MKSSEGIWGLPSGRPPCKKRVKSKKAASCQTMFTC